MCTVSVIATNTRDGRVIRVACNRDELRTRPPALPPESRTFGHRRVLLPIDRLSGGTWIAVSDAGLGMTLLNLNASPDPPQRSYAKSRGVVIPSLLSSDTLDEAIDRALQLPANDYPPFRLLLVDESEITELVSSHNELSLVRRQNIEEPQFVTSSGLGDRLVEAPRRAVFQEMLVHRSTPSQQDRLHRHAWPDQRHVSIWMNRTEAQTVSYTTFEIRELEVVMDYVESLAGEVQSSCFERNGASHRCYTVRLAL